MLLNIALDLLLLAPLTLLPLLPLSADLPLESVTLLNTALEATLTARLMLLPPLLELADRPLDHAIPLNLATDLTLLAPTTSVDRGKLLAPDLTLSLMETLTPG